MYYKVRALAESGNKIILHYFDYAKGRNAAGLESYCSSIHTYKRRSYPRALSLTLPYIVSSRINDVLIKRLNEDPYPILFEGLHCTGIVPFLDNPSRVIIRMHNDEALYYKSLFRSETSFFKKMYFAVESKLLKDYQARLERQVKIAFLSMADKDHFLQLGFKNLFFIPCFVPWTEIQAAEGKGAYCLYHGNMAISENEAAAVWLMEHVFDKPGIPFVIAGNKISAGVKYAASKLTHVRLVENPTISEMEALVHEAQINVLPSMNHTGVKLKLLHALFRGRFCITNPEGVAGSRIDAGVAVAATAESFKSKVHELFHQPFLQKYADARKVSLTLYNNTTNAEKLNALW
jgi:hypothetical protein